MLEVGFLASARSDYDEAVAWYRNKDERAADRFEAAVQAAIGRIRQFPDSGLSVGRGRRIMALSRYPYYLLYRVGPERIVIAAVAHNRQSPGRWRKR